MSNNEELENIPTSALNEIYNQQLWLLNKKAKLLENELITKNSDIDVSYQSNFSDELLFSTISRSENKIKSENPPRICFKIKNNPQRSTLLLFSVLLILTSFILFDDFSLFFDDDASEKFMKSKFVIENLRGDTIDTMKSWRIYPGDAINVNLLNSDKLTTDQYDAVSKVIMSVESIELDDFLLNKGPIGSESTYYLGWAGAMSEVAKDDTVFTVPEKFRLFQSDNGEGHIVIMFSDVTDVDGFSGYTRSILEDGEILKSYITIYDIKNLEASELATIIRHEFGHALGLGHSSDPEDLMAPVILTDFPYISECNVDAMAILYDGHESDQAVCEK